MVKKNYKLDPSDLAGCYTALITPMKNGDGLFNHIDYEKTFQLIDDQVNAGVRGLVVAGTTGQSATLSPDEQVHFVARIFDHVRKNYDENLHFVVGAGSNCTREAIELSRKMQCQIGPSTFLHVTGYYNNPTQEGLFAHYHSLAAYLPDSNIILYNVPGRTGSNILPETAIKLSGVDGIIGIKEASGNLEAVQKIISATDPSKFVVLSGEDHLVADIMKMGGRGVISASANVAPRYFVRLTQAALENRHDDAARIQAEINPLVREAVFYRKNPIPLAEMFNTELRLPLIRHPEIKPHLDEVLARYKSEDLGVDLRKYQ